MPVFHTKTIQTILEPVALQVSTMVVLDEEAGQGGSMPDLSEPVSAVSAAVGKLVTVGKETAESSEDKQLQQDLPRAWEAAEVSSTQLAEAAATLRDNPRSGPGRRLLISGARGILEAVSDLLLTFDESEVRRIISVCESVQEYVKVADVIEIMSDLVIFIKNLTPGLTGLNKLIDNRAKELTNPVHAAKLVEHCSNVKKAVPMLIASVKLVCSLRASQSGDATDAASSRSWLMSTINEDLNEIIRILQIKTSKDDLAQGDFSEMVAKIMGKDEPLAQQAFLTDFESAKQFLVKLDPESADAGLEALDKCLAKALALADHLQDAEMRESLQRQVAELRPMIARLQAMKDAGKLDTAEGRALAKEIAAKIDALEETMREAMVKEVVENFMDPTGPAKQMTNTALLEPTVADREAQWSAKAKAFTNHVEAASRTALQVARSGGVHDEATVHEIMDTIKHLQSLAPQLVSSSKIVLNNYGNEVAVDFMQTLKTEYCQQMDRLTGLMDQATDSVQFLKASEAQIHAGLEKAKASLVKNDTETAMNMSTTVAKQARRVLDVAKAEAENSEDVAYVDRVTAASMQLSQSVKPMVMSCKKSCAEKSEASRHEFNANANATGAAVTEVRKVVEDFHVPPRPPTPPSPDLPPPPEDLDIAPERPPAPVIEEEAVQRIELPVEHQSVAFDIVEAARDLQDEAIKWSVKDNSLIAMARQMALQMAEMGRLFDSSGDPQSRKELINLAKAIAKSTNDIIRLAKATADACTDRRLKQTLLQLIDRLPTISTQLRIISTVKAAQSGSRDARSDREASETLVLNARNLMKSVKEVVQAAQSATIKLKPGSAAELMWKLR
ncbi:vinculin-like [Sycon ciliatum]|uniref:vinculin-like n=1 Tax=Sycon ciliatum TaxID=27933 RepID=UPI0031F60180